MALNIVTKLNQFYFKASITFFSSAVTPKNTRLGPKTSLSSYQFTMFFLVAAAEKYSQIKLNEVSVKMLQVGKGWAICVEGVRGVAAGTNESHRVQTLNNQLCWSKGNTLKWFSGHQQTPYICMYYVPTYIYVHMYVYYGHLYFVVPSCLPVDVESR